MSYIRTYKQPFFGARFWVSVGDIERSDKFLLTTVVMSQEVIQPASGFSLFKATLLLSSSELCWGYLDGPWKGWKSGSLEGAEGAMTLPGMRGPSKPQEQLLLDEALS